MARASEIVSLHIDTIVSTAPHNERVEEVYENKTRESYQLRQKTTSGGENARSARGKPRKVKNP